MLSVASGRATTMLLTAASGISMGHASLYAVAGCRGSALRRMRNDQLVRGDCFPTSNRLNSTRLVIALGSGHLRFVATLVCLLSNPLQPGICAPSLRQRRIAAPSNARDRKVTLALRERSPNALG